MNKLTTHGMSINCLCVVMMFLLLNPLSIFAQDDVYTTIRKNVNPLAFDLNHDLSTAQDSLVLENKFLFKKVRFLNATTEKVFEFKPAVKRAKISLKDFPLGKYTVMFYQADKIIVFQIDRRLPFDYEPVFESDVAMNDDIELDLETDDALANIDRSDLDFDTAGLSLPIINSDRNFEDFEEKFTKTYNISDPNRSNVQSRAEYRRSHLRPNGKPYTE